MGAVLGVIGFLTVTTNSFAACTPVHKFETINTGTLSVTTTSYPPFDNVDASGKFVGVDAEILEKVAERECVKISPTLVDASASIQYVVTGRADMSSGSWYRTAARANVMGVSTPLYLEQMGVYSKQGYSKLAELTGKTVGTVQGYLWVADLKKILGENLKLYPTAVALAQDLEAGRIDTAINTYNAGVDAQRKGGFKGFKVVALQPDSRVAPSVHPAQISFLYAKSNNELGKAINEDIDEMQRKGEIAAILKNYGFDPKSASTGAPRFADVQ
ncbi:amino acid ABC transporter substrate-binding protein [Paraburkholderia sp. WC7.3b]|uniref:Amino acid ABC transporter substrate-binding protein n=2 Tax=Burkholderiaceae TaxID=119060 RepID=A0ABR7PZK4_9BURK|nr:amino acid ABC transporter substrate-binding protein [Paraburkholderia podalyriae]